MATGDEENDAAALLRAHEARGLYVPLGARLLFLGLGLVGVLLERVFADAPVDTLLNTLVFGTLLGTLLLNLYLLHLLRRGEQVGRVGMTGAVFDGLFAIAMSLLAQLAGSNDGLSPGYVFKTEMPEAVMALVAINGLALRPRYPLIVGAGAAAAILVPAIRIALDPTAQLTADRVEVYAGTAFDPGQVALSVILVIGTAAAVSYSAHAARKTVLRGIAQEIEHARMQQDHLAMVMREKVKAMSRLVAGISHEINTPLGALHSSADTQERVLQRLEGALQEVSTGEAAPKAAAQATRLLGVGKQTLSTIRAASDRIHGIETSLRALSHLDEADLQSVDLNRELGTVLDTAQRQHPGGTRVRRNFDTLPNVVVNAREVNQALLTIVTNAFQAAGPEGEVEASTTQRDGAVRIAIRDSGSGVPADALPHLFDVSLKGKHGRMAAGLGLATAQSIAQRHGGRVEVDSPPGQGATFTLQLPCSPPDSTPTDAPP